MTHRRMKIVHVCLRSVYTEGMAYQDNLLPDQNVSDGHDVTVIAGCETYREGRIVYTPPSDHLTASGVRLIRLPMFPLLHPAITARFSRARGLRAALSAAEPDVILYHGAAGADLLTVAHYKRNHPECTLFVDSHEDHNNSGLSMVSRLVQYRLFNNTIIQLTRAYVEKYLYVSLESRDFLRRNYGLRDSEMAFFPLGGVPVEYDKQVSMRGEIRRKEGLAPETFVVLHSGKMGPEKRTLDLARAFSRVSRADACLLIIGSAEADVMDKLSQLMKEDSRIRYLGWRPASELLDYISAADLYAQPGTQSATLQAAICCGAPVLVYPHPSYRPFVQGNGFFAADEPQIHAALEALANDPALVERMRADSRRIAGELLSYSAIAKQMYPQSPSPPTETLGPSGT